MAMPLGWQNYYCFVCSPQHATQHNVEATGEFTVSFPRPEQILHTSMAAGPRIEDGSKPTLAALDTFPASTVDGVLVRGAYLWLECTLERMLEGFGDNSLIIGRVVAASADERALRAPGDEDSRPHPRRAPARIPEPGALRQRGEEFFLPLPRQLQPVRRYMVERPVRSAQMARSRATHV